MAVNVAVVDPLPLFRDGVVAALTAAGHAVHAPADVVAWACQSGSAVVLLTVLGEAEWAILAELLRIETISIVVLLGEESVAAGIRALRAGARSIVGRQVSAEVLQRTVAATIDGQAVLPAGLLSGLVAGAGPHPRPAAEPPAEKLSWLRSLAAGSTVSQLAQQVGYSERAMFRLLQALYRDMGVGGRVEALMMAQEQGWLRQRRHHD